jgi:hypothetical protein
MLPLYKALLLATAVTLQPAAASENTSHVDDVGLAEHVAVAMQSRYQHSVALAPEPVPVLQAHATSRPHRVLSDFARFSASGAAVRFLYSAVADQRTFISYSPSQRGRPAELRVAVRISL